MYHTFVAALEHGFRSETMEAVDLLTSGDTVGVNLVITAIQRLLHTAKLSIRSRVGVRGAHIECVRTRTSMRANKKIRLVRNTILADCCTALFDDTRVGFAGVCPHGQHRKCPYGQQNSAYTTWTIQPIAYRGSESPRTGLPCSLKRARSSSPQTLRLISSVVGTFMYVFSQINARARVKQN